MSYKFDAKEVKDQCVQWIRDWFKDNGPFCKAIVGISGGKDSSIVAALCVEALGKNRVFGVLMPQGTQKDIKCAKELVDFLDIDFTEINIGEVCSILEKEVSNGLGGPCTRQTLTNLPARIRMTTLYAVSQSMSGRVANTCNLSEDWIGYSTRYGDSVGDFSPLSNLTVTEVKAIGYELGLPKHLIDKVPEDGLSGKTDEDNLGFTYEELDKYIREGIKPEIEKKIRIDDLHKYNLFKLQLMPSFKPDI